MKAHRNARTTPYSRALIVRRVRQEGRSVQEAAAELGISRQTVWKWLRRFEAAAAELAQLTDETSCRVFRLYLAGTAYEFQCGRVNLHQSLLVKPNGGRSGVPLTRRDWYRSEESALA